MRTRIVTALILAITLLPTARPASASERDTRWLIEPYFMGPYMKGTTGLGTWPDVDVDESPGDILDKLEFGAMLYTEVRSPGGWVVGSDLVYMKLGQDAEPRPLVATGHVGIEQIGWELDVMREVAPWLDLGVSGALNSVKSGLDIVFNPPVGTGDISYSSGSTTSWVDPGLVAASRLALSRRWSVRLRGNVGGFGVGSETAWQGQAYLGFRASNLVELSAGYRYIDIDYEKGTGAGRFKYDLVTRGPVARLGFHF